MSYFSCGARSVPGATIASIASSTSAESTKLLDAAAAAGEIRSDLKAYELMRGVGNLCIGADSDPDYDARRLVELLMAGLRTP